MIDTTGALARYTTKKKAASTKHVEDANKAFEELKDIEKYRPQYLMLYKRAAKAFIDLNEIKEKAKSAREPGRYFLKAARNILGITKKPNQ
jgi:hypothetical protein